ncbi:MAG: GEVED domain-containing protein, partial [Saprospiraceae bacterium]
GINGSYTAFGGTSGATPQVTGAVALLYSAPCPDLPDLYNSDPAATALLVKDYILDGVDQNNSLDNITLTGGRLNVFNSVQLAIDDCSPCFPPYNLSVTNLSTQTVTLSWTSPVDANNNTLRWRAIGSTNWNMEEGVNSPMDLSGLAVCTNYEFQVFSACDNGSSDYSPVVMFETDGCCKAPEAIEMNDIGLESAMITFTSVTAANSYNITITNQDTGEETTYSSSENTFLIELLESCTPYLVQIQSVCESGEITDYNEGVLFTTFGCGACTDLSYCPSNAEVSLYEWIANVSLNSLNNSSDNDNGYGNYTGLFTEVETYGTYPVSITPEFAGPSYDEYFKIWIDYNQDGDFEEENELAFDPLNPVSETISGEIVIPAEALPGLTRMRVTMKYIGAGDMDAPEACTVDFGFGEVEDYCIRIVEGAIPECDLPFNLDSIASAFNSVTLSWEDPTEDHENHNLRYRKLGTFEWTQLDNIDPPVVLSNLLFCTDYEAQVTANCVNGGSSGYTNILVFKTPCTINTETVLTTQLQIELFPNPVINKLIVSYELPEASDVDISLISLDGRRTNLLSNHFSQSGAQQITFERMDQFPAGLYWLELETEREVKYVKVLLSGIQ